MSVYQGPYAPGQQPSGGSLPAPSPGAQYNHAFPGANAPKYPPPVAYYQQSYGMPYPYPQQYPHPQDNYPPPPKKVSKGEGKVTSRKGLSSKIKKFVPKFVLGQQVEICISGNAWLLGVIVGVLKLVDKVTSGALRYDVRYNLSGQTRTDRFLEEHIRDRGY